MYSRNGNNDELLKYIEKGLCLSVTRKWGERTLSTKSKEWIALRKKILERDNYTCRFCGVRASKWMVCDHLNGDASDNEEKNLGINCILCDEIRHCGQSGSNGRLLLYKSQIPQAGIIKMTYEYFEKNKILPSPQEIDPESEFIENTTVYIANRLLHESPYDIEDFHLLKGFFEPTSIYITRRINGVLENRINI